MKGREKIDRVNVSVGLKNEVGMLLGNELEGKEVDHGWRLRYLKL